MSLLLYPEIYAKDAHLLTCATAVAVCRAVEREHPTVTPMIKWVNDVYAGGRKLCGILCEGECAEDGNLRYAIIGIGINLKNAPHSPEVEAIMTSLENEGVAADPPRLAAEIASEVLSLIGSTAVLSEYKERSMLIGQEIEISAGDGSFTERAIDIDGECALITMGADGSQKRYISGDVKVRPAKQGG